MSATVMWRRVRAIALGSLSLGLASCYEREESGGRIDELFDVVDRVSGKLCQCRTDPDDECGYEPVRLACVRPIVKKHSAELVDWTDCTIRLYEDLEACLERGCNEEVVDPCIDAIDVDDTCGEPPHPIDDAIEEEVERTCLEEISCSDGTFAQGNYCNDITECPDGSDEELCEGESAP